MKGFVFIQGGDFALRFVHTGAFREIEKHHEICYVVLRSGFWQSDAGLDDAVAKLEGRVEWLKYRPERYRKWKELFDVSCAHFEKFSSSFVVRSEEKHKKNVDRKKILEKLSDPEKYKKYKRKLDRDLFAHPELLELTVRERPDFFILPSALLDRMTDDVLQISAKLDIPTLLVIMGWDNLSSKGLLQRHPDVIAVWGEQTKRHAVEVQGVEKERISIVGAPHYDYYNANNVIDKKAIRSELGLPNTDKTLVLFAGTLRQFDETAILLKMDEAIENKLLPDIKIVYRPHPRRTNRDSEDSFFNHSWKHIIMDPEMVKYYEAHKMGKDQVPSYFGDNVGYLPALYSAVNAVISPMSTVLLESLLFGLPVMAVAFGDGKHSWSADKVSQMLHFKEFYEIKEVDVCRDKKDLIGKVKSLLSKIDDQKISEALRESSKQFVVQNDTPYKIRIAQLADEMLSKKTKRPKYDSLDFRFTNLTFKIRTIFKRYASVDLPGRIARRLLRKLY